MLKLKWDKRVNSVYLDWEWPGREGERTILQASWNVDAMLIDRWKTRVYINRDKRSSFEEHRFVLEFDLFWASRKYEIALLRVINHLFTPSGKKRTIALNRHLYLSRIILGFHLQQCFPILLRFRFKIFSSWILSFIIVIYCYFLLLEKFHDSKSCISRSKWILPSFITFFDV